MFALGTSEFMLSGILPAIADDMDVTIPQAGLLISAFAIGMVVGAPLLAVATLRLPRRTTLIALISVFGLGQVAGALAPTYAVLFASRIVSALACAGFWAVGAAVAIAMVPVTQRARAMAVMIGGLSIANVLGVPAGAFLGDGLGWRAAFWAVGVASAIALVGVVTLIPRIPLPAQRPRPRRELAIYRDRQVWLSITVTALAAGGVFCAFSYLSPLLTDVAGLDEGWVPTVLALFGVGALVGTTVGGRVADAHLFGVLLSGIAASTVFLAALALLGGFAVAAVVLSFLLGFSAFYTAAGAERPHVQRGGRGPHARRSDDDGGVQPGQHGRAVARRHGDRRGARLPGDGLGGRGDDGDGDRRDGGVTAPAPRIGHEARGVVRPQGPQLPAAGRPFGLRSPASVSLRTSSFEPTFTAPSRTASS